MDYLNKTPQQLIIEIRAVSGMTDSAIAIEIGMNQSTISRLRVGKVADTLWETWRLLVALHSKKTAGNV